MGGAVGIGALIVGVGLIGVFVIANSAIIAQMDSSLEVIEIADDPSPSISFNNANLNEDALIDFNIATAGQGYPLTGWIEATGGGGHGFNCSYATTGGILTGFTIHEHGMGYTSAPTLVASGTPTQAATFNSLDIGNALFGNLTNDGDVIIDVDHMWISTDGDALASLSPGSYNAFSTFFPSETISILYLQGGVSGSVSSLTVTAEGAVASFRV